MFCIFPLNKRLIVSFEKIRIMLSSQYFAKDILLEQRLRVRAGVCLFGNGHCIDDLLVLTGQHMEPFEKVPFLSARYKGTDLLFATTSIRFQISSSSGDL